MARSQFPRVPRPAKKAAKKATKPKARKHVFIWDATSDWRGQPFCATCDQPRNNPIHDLNQTPPEAAEVDRRRIGEGGHSGTQ